MSNGEQGISLASTPDLLLRIGELNAILSTLTAISQLIVAIIVGFAGIQFYRWQRADKRLDSLTGAVNRYHGVNAFVLADPELQDIERDNHFVPGKLSLKEIKKMYYYFELLNGVGSILQLKRERLVIPKSDRGLYYISTARNIARCTYKDRDFIRTHCLPRGYTENFKVFLDELWESVRDEVENYGRDGDLRQQEANDSP